MINNMKKLLFLFSVIALAACGDSDDGVNTPPDVPSPRLLTVEVGENPMQDESANAREMTRAGDATTTASLSNFYMNYQNNKYTFTKGGTGWNTIPWPTGDEKDTKIDFYAYNYDRVDGTAFQWNGGNPYVAFTMDENAFVQKDFLVATHKQISYNDANGHVSLTFDHACAAVQFNICQTQTVTNQGHKFAVNSVVLKNVCKNGDYYYDSGWKLDSKYSIYTDYTLTNKKAISLTTDYQTLPCQWLFLIPQPQTGVKLEIKYTVDDSAEKTKTIDVGTGSWVKGTKYIINIKVGTSFIIPQS